MEDYDSRTIFRVPVPIPSLLRIPGPHGSAALESRFQALDLALSSKHML
jgi:hypothetical protein